MASKPSVLARKDPLPTNDACKLSLQKLALEALGNAGLEAQSKLGDTSYKLFMLLAPVSFLGQTESLAS
jgi:hypothetical protein